MEIDWAVGQVMESLRSNGLDEKTLIIFTSDNGPWLSYGEHSGSAEPLREGKGTVWEGGTRVPCIMRWPGQIPANTESREMLGTIDLFPTIAGIMGAALPPHKIDGLDVWPILSGAANARNPHAAYFFYFHQNQLQAVISGNWKLMLPHTYRTLNGEPGGRNGKPVSYKNVRITQAELYDLAQDPTEKTNVAMQHPEVVERLMALVEKAREDLGDQLTGRQGNGLREPGRLSLNPST